ncbi:discoidin domain-containing protein [Phnomibacter ginsenosidimutans]|uniref:discoidin domain-containing protein n=1 Tax=Phnomibacter ginsenosidimutans TaxID=2676868 RepID=UPI0024836531|nr:discoidin domain-containing protein [Phnomibacter ginsenosidimutans]
MQPWSDPLSFKPGGYARGAGHGATFQDHWNNYWHVSTMVVNVKNNFERRLGIWPTGFDKDDVMWCNTAYGDYPTFLPAVQGPQRKGDALDYNAAFQPGWMLLNYKKPVQVSSTLGGFSANHAVDENIKTYWSAASANAGEYIISDLGAVSTVHAVQINYADQGCRQQPPGQIQCAIPSVCVVCKRGWQKVDGDSRQTQQPNRCAA